MSLREKLYLNGFNWLGIVCRGYEYHIYNVYTFSTEVSYWVHVFSTSWMKWIGFERLMISRSTIVVARIKINTQKKLKNKP